MIVAIICIAIVVVAITCILAILLYNMMLCLNEHNKRLLELTKESLDNERDARDELNAMYQEFNSVANPDQEFPTKQDDSDDNNFHDPDLD